MYELYKAHIIYIILHYAIFHYIILKLLIYYIVDNYYYWYIASASKAILYNVIYLLC